MSVSIASTRAHTSRIVATGYAHPSLVVDNDDYLARCRFPLDDPDTVAAEAGTVTRYWCDDEENPLDLARRAVSMALSRDPSLAERIDVVIVASATTMPVAQPPRPEHAGVADLAPLIIADLPGRNVLGFDLKAAYCTGFLRGLQTADALLANPNYRAALVVATEWGSRFAVAETNRSAFCFFMSDAAGAWVLERGPKEDGAGLIDHVGWTDGDKVDWVGIGADARSTVMRGRAVGSTTHEMLVGCARQLLERNGLTVDDVDWLLPIQTHRGLVEGLREALDWPTDKLIWEGGRTGFSGGASIPSCLAEAVHTGRVKPGELVLSVAVGAGLNCAGTLYRVG
jgi:3-oxoacyl-[acyl-carrier-protein] synthase-3